MGAFQCAVQQLALHRFHRELKTLLFIALVAVCGYCWNIRLFLTCFKETFQEWSGRCTGGRLQYLRRFNGVSRHFRPDAKRFSCNYNDSSPEGPRGKFVMKFLADANSKEQMCLAIATSRRWCQWSPAKLIDQQQSIRESFESTVIAISRNVSLTCEMFDVSASTSLTANASLAQRMLKLRVTEYHKIII